MYHCIIVRVVQYFDEPIYIQTTSKNIQRNYIVFFTQLSSNKKFIIQLILDCQKTKNYKRARTVSIAK